MLDDGLYHQLAEMEGKLRMAGEFGNALLEENQELRMLHQEIQQETSTKIEVRDSQEKRGGRRLRREVGREGWARHSLRRIRSLGCSIKRSSRRPAPR